MQRGSPRALATSGVGWRVRRPLDGEAMVVVSLRRIDRGLTRRISTMVETLTNIANRSWTVVNRLWSSEVLHTRPKPIGAHGVDKG